MKNSGSKTSENMRVILEFPTEDEKENDSREESIKDVRRILSVMLEKFMRKTS